MTTNFVETKIKTGGWPPMILQAVITKIGRATKIEAWRALDISGGERMPFSWKLTDDQRAQCETWIKAIP